MSILRTFALAAMLVSCASVADDDGRDDDFLSDGKADGSIIEGSPEALGVLAVANTVSQSVLDDDVKLDSRAASGIVAHRTFATLAALDAVPYVGKVAFTKLLAYAEANGYVTADTTWHLENPTPDDRARNATWSITKSNVWTVGTAGLIEHWDGSAWHDVASGVDVSLVSVWASGPNDIWFVGANGTILRWNGSAISTLASGTTRALYDVHGTSANDVWIVGDNDAEALYGLILHWNGTSLALEFAIDCPNSLYTVFANSATDVWVGGAVKTVCHFDGTHWTSAQVADNGQSSVSDLWRSPTGTVWATYAGEIWRLDGATWSHAYSLPRLDDGFLIPSVFSLAGVSDNDLWASGSHGFVIHWDGTTWTPTRIPGNADYSGLARSDASSVWAVGSAARAHFDGTTWTESYHVVTRQWLWSTSASSSSDVWSLGSMGDIVHRDATGWSALPGSLGIDDPEGIFALANDDVWVVGGSAANHWDGNNFTRYPELYDTRAAWGPTSTNVWVVGESGKLAHWNGTAWTVTTDHSGANFYSVAGTGANDVWACGENIVLHYDGTAWTRVSSATGSWSNVLAIAADDVWVSGESQSVMHWNGTAWQTIPATTSDRPWLRDAWAAAPDDVWFVESSNALLHWNGSAFDRTPLHGVSTVLGFAHDEMFTTGEDGWVRRRAL